MGFKTIANLTDGVFADWEILNDMIGNINAVRGEVPSIVLHSKRGTEQRIYTNKPVSGSRGLKGWSQKKMSLEAGSQAFSLLKSASKAIKINTQQNEGSRPVVLLTVEGSSSVKAYISSVTGAIFTVQLKNTSTKKVTGHVHWIAIKAG